MGRVTQAQAQENRQRVVEVAARLVRERGVAGTSVADVMKEAGLTHGGFYKQFASKEALLAEATVTAFGQLADRLIAASERTADHDAARRQLIATYLSPEHRDDVAEGCPTTALAADVEREGPESPLREGYVDGVEKFAAWLGDDVVALSTLVGALTLARATRGTALSDRILAEAAESLGVRGDGHQIGLRAQ